MNSKISSIIEKITELENNLEVEMAKQKAELRFGIEKGKIVFEKEVLRRQKELQVGLFQYLRSARFPVVLTAPVIYSIIVPLVVLDLFVTIYQAVCFPVYGISKVRRSDYIIFDRHQLGYLNVLEKLNCAYCSYANGLVNYVREIAGRTEQYWCPIKHARRVMGAHTRYATFSDFGDAEAYQEKIADARKPRGKRNIV